MTETWASSSQDDAIYNLPGYTLLKKDLVNPVVEWWSIYTSPSFFMNSISSCNTLYPYGSNSSLPISNSWINIGCIYRPGSTSLEESHSLFEDMCIASRHSNELIITGVFNRSTFYFLGHLYYKIRVYTITLRFPKFTTLSGPDSTCNLPNSLQSKLCYWR